MSRRSYDSRQHERRVSKHKVTDEDLFDYALRVAVLSYMMQPKVVVNHTSNESKPAAMDAPEREHVSRLAAFTNFNIGDMFRDVGRDGSKSVKFPDKMIKVLEQRLQDIAMGRDSTYSDQLIRRSMAKFYGQFSIDSFKRQMKDNRKVEELIMLFAAQATSVLRKEPTLAGDGWTLELNKQIAQFIKLIRDCLKGLSHVSPELLSRLDTYSSKLAPTLNATSTRSSVYSDSGFDSSSNRDSYSGPSQPTVSGSIVDMPLVRVVASLFKIPESAMQGEVDQIRGTLVTEKAALTDLKILLKNISTGQPHPGRREDFDSDAAWQHWHTLETSHLRQLMNIIAAVSPELAKSIPPDMGSTSTSTSGGALGGGRPSSMHLFNQEDYVASPSSRHASISSRRSMYQDGAGGYDDDEDDVPSSSSGHPFTFVPPLPRKYYHRLLSLCLEHDLEVMLSPEVDPTEQVSLGILSAPHLELLNECAVRWRIGREYRSVVHVDLVRGFFERGEVPMECVPDALSGIARVIKEGVRDRDMDVETESEAVEMWMIQDADFLANVYASLFNIFLSSLYHTLDSLPGLKRADVESFLDILEHVYLSGLLQRFDIDVEARMNDVEAKINSVAHDWYAIVMEEKVKNAPGVNKALPLLLMTDEIEKSCKGLAKKFPDPLLGRLELPCLFAEVVIALFIDEVKASQKRLFEASMNGPTPDVPIQDIFALYRRSRTLVKLLKVFAPDAAMDFDLSAFFEPYVRQWLKNTDDKTKNWVDAAISQDKFEAESIEGHSSSIVDLFESLKSPIAFLQELEWEDEYQEGRFFTGLSKTISKTIEQYCRSIESLFLVEMYPRPTEYIQPQKSHAWLEKARQMAILTGEKRVEPFNFLPQSCVKLNNVEAARKLLDNIYQQMEVDRLAEIIRTSAPPVPEKKESTKFLFSVKVVIAEGLVPLDGSVGSKLDTFVTLSDEQGQRLAKTRTIYESLNPRWDETFDLSVEKPLWLMVSVRDRSLVGKHDIIGRAYLCLDPRRFNDFFAHELWMDLDTQGRILARVSMEGEKDDIQFYFGRGFRSLKRAEGDMIRIFIDKMTPFIQQCLSRSVLKTLLKSKEQGLDYNKTLAALYRSAVGASNADPQIPIPSSEKPRVRPEDLTDVEIEQAILPLFDYFDSNLQTLNTYLSETAKQKVMEKVWKEILGIVEGLLIPPLTDVESDMKPLSDKEVDVVFRWLKFLKDYFYANGEGPVPLEMLQNQKYREVMSIRLYYDWDTDLLMEECVRMMQQTFRDSPSLKKRAKSVYTQRNLGTIKERKKEKQQETETKSTSEQTIMRILRMRPRTHDFIAQQLQIMATMQAEQERRAKETEERKAKRQQRGEQVPPLPPLPEKDLNGLR
ncbi:hypothetical protein CPB83DRAFT_853670 [Crepidotus variabilis]|uniref:Uncharacterized protein n=1 Tax=Crepidotus variabilis TaxID=179855 RepID=A0A9P6EGM2_9AGAR|nr:hypothetical protein CPB83DRAFT_853670 [Crepidotus variabilis]